eukprot:2741187-Karenia_brevis.AAC.1
MISSQAQPSYDDDDDDDDPHDAAHGAGQESPGGAPRARATAERTSCTNPQGHINGHPIHARPLPSAGSAHQMRVSAPPFCIHLKLAPPAT